MAIRVEAVSLTCSRSTEELTNRAVPPTRRVLAHDVPGLQRVAQLELNAVIAPGRRRESGTRPALRTSGSKAKPCARRSASTPRKSSQTKWGSMNRSCSGCPSAQRPAWGSRQNQRIGADQELLGEIHARVGRHLEGAELDKPEPPGGPSGE